MIELKKSIRLGSSQVSPFLLYGKLGYENHYRPSYYIWVSPQHPDIVTTDNGETRLRLPCRGVVATVAGKNNTLKIEPGNNLILIFTVPAGFRGDSELQVISKVLKQVKFKEFASPQGRLGVSEGAIVEITPSDLPIVARFKRTGRVYGALSEGIITISLQGDEPRWEVSPLPPDFR